MHIHSEKIGITASLATLECYISLSLSFRGLTPYRKAYQSLIDNIKTGSSTPDTNPVVVKREEHPLVMLWDTNDYSEVCRERGEFPEDAPAERGPGRSAKGENVMFWFLQYADGTIVSGCDVTSMRRASKEIWTTMLEKYNTLAPNWTALTPAQQHEFYLDIEAKYTFLRLCKDHYKAQKIGVFDYTQWYKNRQKALEKAREKASKKRCHSKTEPSEEDTKQDTPDTRKRLRRIPSTSLPRRVSLRLRKSRSQIPGEADDPATATLSTPPPPRSDTPPVLPPSSLISTSSNSLSPATPDNPSACIPPITPGGLSSDVPMTNETIKSPMLDPSSTCTSGLDKSVDSHSGTVPTTECQSNDFVRFFYSSLITSDVLYAITASLRPSRIHCEFNVLSRCSLLQSDPVGPQSLEIPQCRHHSYPT